MAIVIRFNAIIVRKSSIEAKYPGGLDAYRSFYLPNGANFYYEDRHLIAHTSMGAFYGVYDRLFANGLAASQGGASLDSCGANQMDGLDRNCQWLEAEPVGGLPVCWVRDSPPGFVTDFKSRRFVHRVSATSCPRCGVILGIGAAAEAVDQNERKLGPLKVVHENPSLVDAFYVVWCPCCKHETVFTDDGRLVAASE